MWIMLVIDDEERRIKQIRDWFKSRGFRILSALTAEEGLMLAQREKPDVIVLDLLLPDRPGEDVLADLVSDEKTSTIPIVVFSIKGNDHVTQIDIWNQKMTPIVSIDQQPTPSVTSVSKWDLRALEAAVQGLLKQQKSQPTPVSPTLIRVQGHELLIRESYTDVEVDGVAKHLTPRMAQLLKVLLEAPGRALSPAEIEKAWGEDTGGGAARRVIERLRTRIEPNPKTPIFIVNDRGYGYKLALSDNSTTS